MKPTTTLAEARTPDGARLALRTHDGHYGVFVDGDLLSKGLANHIATLAGVRSVAC